MILDKDVTLWLLISALLLYYISITNTFVSMFSEYFCYAIDSKYEQSE